MTHLSEPNPTPPPHRRSARRWLVLFIVWGIGLAVWTIYIAVIIAVFVRFFA